MHNKHTPKKPISTEAKGRTKGIINLPFLKRPIPASLFMGGLSCLLLVAAVIVYITIYHEGVAADQHAKDLLNQYQAALSQTPAAADTATLPPDAPSTDGSYTQPPDVDPKAGIVSLPGYDVIGQLIIEKIGVNLPVISKTTTKALKVSVCWYSGAMPGIKGNMILTGHNYASGAHFGRLSELMAGDTVQFKAPDGKTYRYTVYETQVVKPDNLTALDQIQGEYALTLITCESQGNRRLLVRCKVDES